MKHIEDVLYIKYIFPYVPYLFNLFIVIYFYILRNMFRCQPARLHCCCSQQDPPCNHLLNAARDADCPPVYRSIGL